MLSAMLTSGDAPAHAAALAVAQCCYAEGSPDAAYHQNLVVLLRTQLLQVGAETCQTPSPYIFLRIPECTYLAARICSCWLSCIGCNTRMGAAAHLQVSPMHVQALVTRLQQHVYTGGGASDLSSAGIVLLGAIVQRTAGETLRCQVVVRSFLIWLCEQHAASRLCGSRGDCLRSGMPDLKRKATQLRRQLACTKNTQRSAGPSCRLLSPETASNVFPLQAPANCRLSCTRRCSAAEPCASPVTCCTTPPTAPSAR